MGRRKGSKNKPKKPIIKISPELDMIERNLEDRVQGIFTEPNEESFKSCREIEKETLQKAKVQIEEGSMPTDIPFEEFTDYLINMAAFRERVEGESRTVEINIDTDRPIAIALLSDAHTGSAYTDYELLRETARVIKEHPLAYCITGGDITDSLFFAYGDEILNMQGQYVFMQKLLREGIGAENILAGVVGNHENWATRTGATNYVEFSNSLQRPLLHGVSYIYLTVGQQLYKIMISHKFSGSSLRNPTHAQSRANEEIPGADIVMSADSHKPGESNIYPSGFGDLSEKVVLVNGKTFQKSSNYGKSKGFRPVPRDARGCNWVVLNHDKRMIRVQSSTEEMLETMSGYLK